MSRAKSVYLVDGSGQFHRAFHAIRGLATSEGLPTNATYGFTTLSARQTRSRCCALWQGNDRKRARPAPWTIA